MVMPLGLPGAPYSGKIYFVPFGKDERGGLSARALLEGVLTDGALLVEALASALLHAQQVSQGT